MTAIVNLFIGGVWWMQRLLRWTLCDSTAKALVGTVTLMKSAGRTEPDVYTRTWNSS